MLFINTFNYFSKFYDKLDVFQIKMIMKFHWTGIKNYDNILKISKLENKKFRVE